METISATAHDDSSGANPSSVKSDDSSPRHESGRGSPPPNCAICLGTCRNKSFTDSCLHQFCFKCLLTWSRVKAECPLCKQNFRSIIHNVRSNHQYEEYMVEQRQTEETIERFDFDSLAASTRRFRYRTTLTLPRHDSIAIQQLLMRHYPMADVFHAPPARRRRSPAAFRRTVYRHNLWARPLPDFTGRFRDCMPEFYRYNDSQMHRLVPWLNRELHYLLNENIGHISYVIARILELLPQFHINSPEFRQALQVYFRDRTEHFLHELYCFASTPYDMTGYDRNVQYTTDIRISAMVNEVISSTESDNSVDSDIVMVSSSEPAEPPPGPSRLPAPVYPQNYIPQPTTDNVIPIETISNSDTDDDSSEVMVVGYIKPPQDRTPEVVDLLGSDSDVIVQDTIQPEPQPHTSENQETRHVPLVKLILKRHEMQGNADSDSDNSTIRAPPTRRKRRHRSTNTATTVDTCRTTPSPVHSWEAGSSSKSTISELPSPSSTSTQTASSDSCSTTDDSDSWNRKVAKKKKYKRKRRDNSSTTNDKKRHKKRKSRSTQKEKPVAQTDKNSKRKSTSGKGVKSSKKKEPPVVSQEEPVATSDQPSTSNVNKNKSKNRKRSSANKRLKSVVNVMYKKSSSETSSNSTSGSSFATTSGTTKSDGESHQYHHTSTTLEGTPTTANKADSTDSDDDLPLNLSVQKTYTSL